MNYLKTLTIASTGLALALPLSLQSAHAETCMPLPVVDGQSTQVSKVVSVPPTGVTRSNWNTDFAIPGDRRFSRYVATILPQNGGEYQVQMALKYPDDTADTVYDQTTTLPEQRAVNISGTPRIGQEPYQVNLTIGGIAAVGNSYTVRVAACY
jgi:hypothetical protein